MMKITIAALAATLNADNICGPAMPMLPLQYPCPIGDPVALNDLTLENWSIKTCADASSKSRSRRSADVREANNKCWYNERCPQECDDFVRANQMHLNGCWGTRRIRGEFYCPYRLDHAKCTNPARSNDGVPGENPNWVSEQEQDQLGEMKSSYNLVVNVVNVESPYEDKVQVDGLDKINELVKSILISLFSESSLNAKYVFILEGSNTSQVYHTVADNSCPGSKSIENGLMVVDEAMQGQTAIPSKLAKNFGYNVETWDVKFASLLGYLEDNVDVQHENIMVNHFQFAKNAASIDQSQATNTTEELKNWRTTMASNGKLIKEMKLAFHFIGEQAEDSFDQLEKAMKGQTNSQSIAFNDGNDNTVKAIEFNDDILLLSYDSGVGDKLQRPDVFPILKIIKSFIDYESYFDLKSMSSSYTSATGSASATLLTPLLSFLMISVAQLLF